ncbi:MAG: hypothetical protein M5U12_33130 [Verrucomicrobia bacterium]|nr:hypothetical protein [Verrucomicrobiota bacterium]
MAHACAARLGNTVYVAGGLVRPDATNALHIFWALDLAPPGSAWRELEPWPGPARMLAVAAVQSGAFHLVSGASLSGDAQGKPVRAYLRDAYRFTPGAGWKRLADLPHPAVAAPSPALTIGQSHFVVLGGDTGAAVGFEPPERHPGFSATALAYHTITDTWVPFGDLPAPRVTAPGVEWRGRFNVLSGETHPGRRSPEVWSAQAVRARTSFGWLNSATLVLYLVAMVGIGSSFARRNRTTNDFFRGGQRIPWWAAGLSIFATMLSSITFMAIPAQSYSVGWNLFLANSYLLLTPLIVAVYLPFYRRLDVTSAYEYLERRFNTATRLLASALFILFQLGRIAIVLYLPSLALAAVSNLDVSLCIIVMGGLCIAYTVLGGIEAVIWTDAAQAIILLGGALVALLTLVGRVDGGWAGVFSTAATHGRFFETVPWNFDYTVGAAGIIIVGSLFANLFPYTASQDVVQRYPHDGRPAHGRAGPLAQRPALAGGPGPVLCHRHRPLRLLRAPPRAPGPHAADRRHLPAVHRAGTAGRLCGTAGRRHLRRRPIHPRQQPQQRGDRLRDRLSSPVPPDDERRRLSSPRPLADGGGRARGHRRGARPGAIGRALRLGDVHRRHQPVWRYGVRPLCAGDLQPPIARTGGADWRGPQRVAGGRGEGLHAGPLLLLRRGWRAELRGVWLAGEPRVVCPRPGSPRADAVGQVVGSVGPVHGP